MNDLSATNYIDLAHLGLLQVSGVDAKKLLQGQLTCNMDEVTAERSLLGAHCNPQGRILSFFRIFLYRESYYLQMPQEMIAEAKAALQKYAVFFKVTLTDATHMLGKICCHATALSTVENDFLKIPLPGTADYYEIIGEPSRIDEIKKNLSAVSDSVNAWKAMNIAAGIPEIYKTTSAKFLPHEINLQLLNAVSFEKGCYTGQEIIARMHYRGQLKKQMYRGRVQISSKDRNHATELSTFEARRSPPQPGADIFNAEGPCGTLVDSAQDEHYDQILVITNIADKENKQLFLDPAKIDPIEFLPLSLG